MKALKRVIVVFVLIYMNTHLIAQQDAMYTHYMYNTLAVNPAYAGSRDALTATFLHRSQWTGFKGAPQSQTFTLHTPLKNEHIGLGFSATNDQEGPVHSTGIYGDFAYIMKLNEKSHLSLGLEAGFTLMQVNLTSLALDDQSDQAFQSNVVNKALPNFGFGAYYFRERFYAGISVPKLVDDNFKAGTTSGSAEIASEKRHYFFIAGTQLKINDFIEFKPTTFVKVTNAAPIQADLTVSFIFNKRVLTGLMVRSGDALGALIGINITEQFHVGYSFDWSYTNKTFKYNGGSHEIMLSYDFIFRDKARIRSPRYF